MDTIQGTIRAFLSSLNTDSTRQSYSTPLRLFCAFLAEQDIQPGQVSADTLTVQHAIDFVPWLRERNPAKATTQLYLTAVYRLYRHLLKQGSSISAADLARLQESYRDARDIRGESRPKEHKLEAVQAVIRAARAVQKKAEKDLGRLRDVAIVETLRATGCRVGELAGMCLGDLDTKARSALVKGKGSKWRKIYWDKAAWKALCTYLWARQDGDKALPVFCGHGNRSKGAPLTTRSVSRIVQTLRKRAGVADVTPHYFRHVFATRALDRTDNLAVVQDMLGHASPATTRVYARTDENQRQAAHEKVWE